MWKPRPLGCIAAKPESDPETASGTSTRRLPRLYIDYFAGGVPLVWFLSSSAVPNVMVDCALNCL